MEGLGLHEARGCAGQHVVPCNLVLSAPLQCFEESPFPHVAHNGLVLAVAGWAHWFFWMEME